MMTEPTEGMAVWQSFKRVLAGEIVEVHTAGCYVRQADGTAVFRTYPKGMTTRYQPVVGDFWVVYAPDDYQSISPRDKFIDGYVEVSNDHPVPVSVPFGGVTSDRALPEQIRSHALGLALNVPPTADHGTEAIIARAKAFETYLAGRKDD